MQGHFDCVVFLQNRITFSVSVILCKVALIKQVEYAFVNFLSVRYVNIPIALMTYSNNTEMSFLDNNVTQVSPIQTHHEI